MALSLPLRDRLLGETYYPSCVVNLRMLFDDKLMVNPQRFPSTTVNQNLPLPSAAPSPAGGPAMLFDRNQGQSQVAGRIPIQARIELPAYRSAGKFDLTFDFNDLPIDPRIVRSLGVTIYLDTVPGRDFASKMGQPPQRDPTNGQMMMRGSRLSMLQPSLENCALQGVADSWQVTHTASGSTVRISGRDLRGVLLDSPITPAMLADCPLEKPIHEVVQWIVSKHPYGKQITIATPNPAEWLYGVIPSPATADGITSISPRVKRGLTGKMLRTPNASADANTLNFWDIITRYCFLVGAVPYFQAEQLVIKPARDLYSQATGQLRTAAGTGQTVAGLRTPFADGDPRATGTEKLYYRRLVFGRNIEEMNVERKMGGRTSAIVEVVSLDTSSEARGQQKLRIASWPAANAGPAPAGTTVSATDNAGAQVNGVAPSGAFGKKDVIRVSVPGITDQKRLQQIAQDYYEEISRGELGGSVKTKSLSSFGAGNEDPDLLRLRPGDAMELAVDTTQLRSYAPHVSPLNDQTREDANALVERLSAQFGDANLARAVVATMRNAVTQLINSYRVSNVVFDWDVKSGVSVSFDFHNYIETRSGVTPIPTATGLQAVTTTAAGAVGS